MPVRTQPGLTHKTRTGVPKTGGDLEDRLLVLLARLTAALRARWHHAVEQAQIDSSALLQEQMRSLKDGTAKTVRVERRPRTKV